jgi:hypothetical protein
MIESAGIQASKNIQRCDINRATESVFAEYQKKLLERYDIFAVDISYEGQSYEESMLTNRVAYYSGNKAENEITKIEYLTDNNCQAFVKQANKYVTSKYGMGALDDLLGETGDWTNNDENVESAENDSQDNQEELDKLLEDNETSLPEEDNTLGHVNDLKSSPILTLVKPKDMEISEKAVELSGLPSGRELNKGRGDFSSESVEGTTSKLVFGQYILEHFKSAVEKEETEDTGHENSPLNYEIEYILGGKSSDSENLESVVLKILGLRFASNYIYLQTDEVKKSEARAMALAVCSLIALPALVEIATQALIAAWAFGESVADVRSLLKGGKVVLVKDSETWKLSIESLLKLGTDEDEGTDDDESGNSYQDYLRMLLFLKSEEDTAKRAIDVIEQNLKLEEELSFFKVDYCMSQIKLDTTCKLLRGIEYNFPTYYGYQ